ncbi:hypothetical protein NQ314_016336 [Rhamnusium bicolor]|uniref:THAP-type domain-containing protein n=1 Tax=Rhamnusium bicolor TaxID=1586634 RepID=A0AAV8WWG9_9CUCU|nr:hypothetical protein NQ314_016336 [Rhamnusium bicolor]
MLFEFNLQNEIFITDLYNLIKSNGEELKDEIRNLRFPKNVGVKLQWLKAIRKTDWMKSKFSRICSIHFEENFFIFNKNGIRNLTKNAIPTLNLPEIICLNKGTQRFDGELNEVSSDLQAFSELEVSRSSTTMDITSPTTSRPSTTHYFYSNLSIPSTSAINFSDNESYEDKYMNISYNDTPRKRRLKHEVRRLSFISEKRKKIITHLQQNKSRCKEKIENLKSISDELYEKKLLNNEERNLLSYFDESLPMYLIPISTANNASTGGVRNRANCVNNNDKNYDISSYCSTDNSEDEDANDSDSNEAVQIKRRKLNHNKTCKQKI